MRLLFRDMNQNWKISSRVNMDVMRFNSRHLLMSFVGSYTPTSNEVVTTAIDEPSTRVRLIKRSR